MSTAEYVKGPAGVALRIQESNGPLVTINQDGTITLNKATPDEAAKMFWDAVNVHGMTLTQEIKRLNELVLAFSEQCKVLDLQVKALSLDPFKTIVHGTAADIRREMHPLERKGIEERDIDVILGVINRLAAKVIQ